MLSIVTIAYGINGIPELEEMTLSSMEAIRENTLGLFEHIIVHNGDTMRSLIEVPHREISCGPGSSISNCYNKGFSIARGQVFCCLHNDVRVKKGWNLSLEEMALKNKIAFPIVEELRYAKTWPLGSACFMISRKNWELLGGYDEDYKGCHYEDEDLFLRARKKGIELFQSKDSNVQHLRRMTRSLIPFKQDEGWIAMNHPIFIEKHGNEGAVWLKKRWGNLSTTKSEEKQHGLQECNIA